MAFRRRRFLKTGTLTVLGGVAGCTGAPSRSAPAVASQGNTTETETTTEQPSNQSSDKDVVVKQEPGKAFYWVLPGKRQLSPTVFGTPDQPRGLVAPKIEQARQLPSPLNETVPELLKELPILVGVPRDKRELNEDCTAFTTTTFATPFSDEGRVTSGQLEVTYKDRRPYDLPGKLTDTPDSVDLKAKFTDPAGHEYQLKIGTVFQPPIPGYETGGGVMTGAWHHGITGTGSPLMPQVFAYGAFWGVGNVIIDGEVADEKKVIHFMTTQTVRNRQYELAIDEEMPLKPEETIAGQVHHTHGIVLPITVTDRGPTFEPVNTEFTLPNGEKQPFIHAMWEEDTLVEAPFKEWEPSAETTAPTETQTPTETAARETTAQEETTTAEGDFVLGAETPGWQGIAPSSVEDQTNPELNLQAGKEYTVSWRYLDGLPHNFVIEDGSGNDVVTTKIERGKGTVRSVTFTATEEMEEYYCAVHPQSMRGTVSAS